MVGINDPEGFPNNSEYLNMLSELMFKRISILLSHRAENFKMYADKFDLVLTGHAHGGQFRFPFLGGLVAPNQGFFPKFTAALHKKGNTQMIISRGLGNSIIPLIIYNRPDLVVVTLK